jgi:hypothetical protein
MGSIYSVNEWGSHPDNDNDDCWTGRNTHDLAEAIQWFNEDPNDTSTAYVELVVIEDPNSSETVSDPTMYQIRKNPGYKPTPDYDSDWRREIAMQAGMGGGCNAYNEVMGY